ncbi:hypothetical protein IKQ02_04095 [bacterium]|nr:hypothetical protein [bacterium]
MDKLVEVKNGELFYNGYSLKELAKKYDTPLKVTFLDLIKARITTLKDSFDTAIKELNYNGSFIYLNANKANYGALEIKEALEYANGLETSSYYDLLLTKELMKNDKQKFIVSNGYKPNDYLNAIISAKKDGYNIIDIIDSIDEYERLKESKISLNVGLRIHLSAKYIEEGDVISNDRFGLLKDEFEYIVNDIKNTNLTLTTIHFHQRGFDYEKDKFELNFLDAFRNYYAYAKRIHSTVKYFNIGGGTPLPTDNNFNYYSWAKYVISLLKEESKKLNIEEPSIITENGKYSQKDSTVNIYKVIAKKSTDKDYPWYIVDSSMLIALPEYYSLGEPIVVAPVNNLDGKMIKARLAGVTCDCDDVYYFKDKGYIELPEKYDDLYIVCLGTGSYQNSMNGKGGVHHCLLPEEKDIVIKNGNVKIRSELQTIDDIYKKIKL